MLPSTPCAVEDTSGDAFASPACLSRHARQRRLLARLLAPFTESQPSGVGFLEPRPPVLPRKRSRPAQPGSRTGCTSEDAPRKRPRRHRSAQAASETALGPDESAGDSWASGGAGAEHCSLYLGVGLGSGAAAEAELGALLGEGDGGSAGCVSFERLLSESVYGEEDDALIDDLESELSAAMGNEAIWNCCSGSERSPRGKGVC